MGDTVKLGHILSTVAGRTVQTEEIVSALGVARSTYYLQLEEGRLITPDNIFRLAKEFNINPIKLLVDCELVTAEEVKEYGSKTKAALAKKRRLNPRRDLPPV